RTPLNGWFSSRVKTAPIGTKPSAACDCSGEVAMNCRSRTSSNGLPANVGTSSGALHPWELANPVTLTISSLGSALVRRTSTLVTKSTGSSDSAAASGPTAGIADGSDPGAYCGGAPTLDFGGLLCARASPARPQYIKAAMAKAADRRSVLCMLFSETTELISKPRRKLRPP